jgi:hypothetical protein
MFSAQEPISHIVEDCATEQHRFLLYKTNLSAEVPEVQVLDVLAVKCDRTCCLIVPSLEKCDYARLASPGSADESGGLFRRYGDRETVENDTSFSSMLPVHWSGCRPDVDIGSIFEVLSIVSKSSTAAVAALVMLKIWRMTVVIAVAATMRAKITLVHRQHRILVRRGRNVSRYDGTRLCDLPRGVHANALPESEPITRIDAKEACREHDAIVR